MDVGEERVQKGGVGKTGNRGGVDEDGEPRNNISSVKTNLKGKKEDGEENRCAPATSRATSGQVSIYLYTCSPRNK